MSLFCLPKAPSTLFQSVCTRSVSTSPYGRTHVYKRRPNKLPNPLVPHFVQRVYRADGSSFTHWTTSPRSRIRLTRDTTNNPLWNATARLSGSVSGGVEEEEEEGTGRMGRFRRRFGKDVGVGEWDSLQDEAMATGSVMAEPPINKKAAAKPTKK
ncbi:hypothetical protein BV22DRAFT_1061762 [Leucogyrophana mollusca]|uniref:Uncharacterized protein n=1 Tax=Leucogyrophana mollusca TaxID=85980 RepID=A0ACB8BP89_9AGAM|nr:hypothetical protein BV22DRAFT_1061762 [Leucogyrophana mollusca]